MKPTDATFADWRAQVEKELAGIPFDNALVHTTPEGLAIQPLYTHTEIDPGLPGAAPFVRGASTNIEPFRICMRVDPAAHRRAGALAEDVDGGADALWLDAGDTEALEVALKHRLGALVEATAPEPGDAFAWLVARVPGDQRMVLALDPVTGAARGDVDAAQLDARIESMARVATMASELLPNARVVRVSGLPFHTAGADAADELALVLATGVAYLRALLATGLGLAAATQQFTVQVGVGRDTFGELCKLRALRACWHRVFAAAGAPDAPLHALHAVCSPRTKSQRDPWVNMLRTTTEVFAAALGGAQLVTPLAFDEALGVSSAHGRRVARNTALVLREESHLGRVIDPAGGAYYLETRTDELAREAWSRFTAIERDGGIVRALTSGALRARMDGAYEKRSAAIARRKEPVLGVTEFANVDETLPATPPVRAAMAAAPSLVEHRDGEAFEALRSRVAGACAVALITLGPPSEHRARVGYATALFATAGLRITESATAVRADIACLCGSDERYATEAADRAIELRALGCRHVVLAGRPGALESVLRDAGVDAFVFVGCDALATLTALTTGDA